MYVCKLVFARSGWQFAFAYRSLTPSMNNNDPGYVNYEAIIYETVEEWRGKEGRPTRVVGGPRAGYCTPACITLLRIDSVIRYNNGDVPDVYFPIDGYINK